MLHPNEHKKNEKGMQKGHAPSHDGKPTRVHKKTLDTTAKIMKDDDKKGKKMPSKPPKLSMKQQSKPAPKAPKQVVKYVRAPMTPHEK